jgi:LemA protein
VKEGDGMATTTVRRMLPAIWGPVLGAILLSGCGYNQLVGLQQNIQSAWAQVQNQLQRRNDLIPNLVNTVKGYAAQESSVLIGVTEARARATSIQVTPETLNDPETLKRFQEAQGQLTSALSRLIAVAENYPDLKSNQNFLALQAQLEGTENRITVARNRYIESVQTFNATVRRFPVNLTAKLFGYDVKPNFTVENESEIAKPPVVEFNPPAKPAEPPANPPSN